MSLRNYWGAISMKPLHRRSRLCLTPSEMRTPVPQRPQKLELICIKGRHAPPTIITRNMRRNNRVRAGRAGSLPFVKASALLSVPNAAVSCICLRGRPPSINSNSLSIRLRDKGGLREDPALLRDLLIAHLELQRKLILRFILFPLLATQSQKWCPTLVELTWYT